METTTTFANTTEQVTAKPIVPIQDSVEISAIASCKKVDETVEPIVTPREKAQAIVPTQESIQVSEIQIEDTVKDFKDERTQVVADRKTLVQESVSVSEVMTEQIAKKFTEEHTEVKAEHKLSVQDSLNVSEVISDVTVQDFANEEVVEERAIRTTSIQKPLVVSEVQSEITVKELTDTQELVKADKKVSVQESVTVSEVQSEDIVEELADMKPKLHHAKPEKKAPTSDKVTVSEIKTEEIKQDEQVISKIIQEKREEVIQSEEIIHKENFTHAEEILKTQQTKIATEIEELMNFIQAKEFGPGESPLRDLARIGYLVRNGITVNEITSLYQADRFPALQTPVAQSALVQLVEREGHGALISQVLTEETTTDEAVVGETVGFRAFMRMVELKHAAVEEVITHFSPEDFRPCAWEAQEAVEVVDKGMVQEKTQVTQEAEVLVQEKRKQKRKTKQRQEVETEGLENTLSS